MRRPAAPARIAGVSGRVMTGNDGMWAVGAAQCSEARAVRRAARARREGEAGEVVRNV